MDASDLQRKLETLNKWIDMEARTEQANRHFNFIGRCKYLLEFLYLTFSSHHKAHSISGNFLCVCSCRWL